MAVESPVASYLDPRLHALDWQLAVLVVALVLAPKVRVALGGDRASLRSSEPLPTVTGISRSRDPRIRPPRSC